MSEWRTDEPPKDMNCFLADVGYPWAVIAVWSGYDQQYVCATLQCNMVDGIEGDTYFENEYERDAEIKRWMPLPGLS